MNSGGLPRRDNLLYRKYRLNRSNLAERLKFEYTVQAPSRLKEREGGEGGGELGRRESASQLSFYSGIIL